MPNRILKESIKRSPTIDQLSWFEESLFIRLIVTVDDYGCTDGRPVAVRSDLFPTRNTIKITQIEKALDHLEKVKLIYRYKVDNMEYIYLPTFEEHQRVRNKRPKYPLPPESITQERRLSNAGQMSVACPSSVSQVSVNCPSSVNLMSDACPSESNPNPIQTESLSESLSESKRISKTRKADVRDFDKFWSIYPRHDNKQAAKKAFDKICPDGALLEIIITAITNQKACSQWSNPQFIPYASTWLNNRRWEDEPVKNENVKRVTAQQYKQREYNEEELEKRLRVDE